MMYLDSARYIVTGTIGQDKAIYVTPESYHESISIEGSLHKGEVQGREMQESSVDSSLKSVASCTVARRTTFGSCRAREIQFSLNSAGWGELP